MVTWGGVSIDVEADNNSDSGRGTDIVEKEIKPNLDEGEKIKVKIAVGVKGRLTNTVRTYGGEVVGAMNLQSEGRWFEACRRVVSFTDSYLLSLVDPDFVQARSSFGFSLYISCLKVFYSCLATTQ